MKININLLILKASLASLFVLNADTSQERKKTDLEKAELKGKVSRLWQQNYSYYGDFDESEKQKVETSETLFDKRGNAVQFVLYDRHGDIEEIETSTKNDQGNPIEIVTRDYYGSKKSKFLYDDQGNVSVIESANYDSKDKLQYWNRYTYSYDSKGNKLEESVYDKDGNLRLIYTCAYDSKGNKLQEVKYDDDGEIRHKNSFKYDSRGNKIEKLRYIGEDLIEKFNYSFDSKGNLLEDSHYSYYESKKKMEHIFSYKYDSRGNKIEEIEKKSSDYDDDYNKKDPSLGDKKTYKYDSKGHLIESKEYYFSEIMTSKRTCAYDATGNKIKETYYNKDGKITLKTIFTFDSRGNKLEEAEYSEDGDLTISKYDANGNRIEEGYYSYDEYDKEQIFLYKTIFTFDSRGNKLEEAEYEDDGTSILIYTCTYNSKGNKLQEVEYDDGEMIKKNSFKYDKNGNWTLKKETDDDNYTKVHERKIYYHD